MWEDPVGLGEHSNLQYAQDGQCDYRLRRLAERLMANKDKPAVKTTVTKRPRRLRREAPSFLRVQAHVRAREDPVPDPAKHDRSDATPEEVSALKEECPHKKVMENTGRDKTRLSAR